MRILLDHNLDWRLGELLQPHEVITTRRMRWDRFENGHLDDLSAKDNTDGDGIIRIIPSPSLLSASHLDYDRACIDSAGLSVTRWVDSLK